MSFKTYDGEQDVLAKQMVKIMIFSMIHLLLKFQGFFFWL